MPKLTTLYLNYNKFNTNLSRSYFQNVVLNSFYCNACGLTDMDEDTFDDQVNLRILSLSTNAFAVPRGRWFKNTKSLATSSAQLSLSGNPFNCDCHALSYKDLLYQYEGTVTAYKNSVLCVSPSYAKNVYLDNVKPQDLLANKQDCPLIATATPPTFTTTADPRGVCPTECTCRGFSVNCENAGLTSIPSNLPEDSTLLVFTNNSISSISSADFSYLRRLQELDLDYNLLTNLPSGTFNANKKLVEINFSNNKISSFDSSSSFSSNVEQLNLSNNVLGDNGGLDFQNLANLNNLQLSNNQLTIVDDNMFTGCSKLSTISLDGNQITAFPAFTTIAPVNLNLSSNALEGLSNYPANAQNYFLTNIDVSQNEISKIDASFFGNFPNATSILLGGNQLSSVTSGVFNQVRKILAIDLSNNQLSDNSLPANLFQFNMNLQNIDLSFNKFSNGVPAAVLLVPSLSTLKITDNQLTGLGNVPTGFSSTNIFYLYISGNNFGASGSLDDANSWLSMETNLLTLDASNCQLSSIPAVFSQLTNLRTLTLSGNSGITSIKVGDISSPTLQQLTMDHCGLSSENIDDAALQGLPTLSYVNWDYNQLITPKVNWFKNLNFLSTLIWSNNNWDCNCQAIPFDIFLQNAKSTNPLARLLKKTVQCNTNFQGQYIEDLQLEQLNAYGTCDSYTTPAVDIPCPCSCYSGGIVNCENLGLTEMPLMPASTTQANLNGNKITKIKGFLGLVRYFFPVFFLLSLVIIFYDPAALVNVERKIFDQDLNSKIFTTLKRRGFCLF